MREPGPQLFPGRADSTASRPDVPMSPTLGNPRTIVQNGMGTRNRTLSLRVGAAAATMALPIWRKIEDLHPRASRTPYRLATGPRTSRVGLPWRMKEESHPWAFRPRTAFETVPELLRLMHP